MDHCEIEEKTILVYLCNNVINRRTSTIVDYDAFWDNFDFSFIPPASLLCVAQNIIHIIESRRSLYEQSPKSEENEILWETFARISTKIAAIVNNLTDMFNSANIETYLNEKLSSQVIEYKNLLQNQFESLQTREDEISKEIMEMLQNHQKSYDKSFLDICWDNVHAFYSLIDLLDQLDNSKYTPLDIGETGKWIDSFFSNLSLIERQGNGGERRSSGGSTTEHEDEDTIWYSPMIYRGCSIEFGSHIGGLRNGTVVQVAGDGALDIELSDGNLVKATKPTIIKPITYTLSRQPPDFKGGVKPKDEYGLIEYDILVCDLGMDIEVGPKGFVNNLEKGYSNLWTKGIDYSSLPKSVLEKVCDKLAKVVEQREAIVIENEKNGKPPCPFHINMVNVMKGALKKAATSLKTADNAPSKVAALNSKKEETLRKRQDKISKNENDISDAFKDKTKDLRNSIPVTSSYAIKGNLTRMPGVYIAPSSSSSASSASSASSSARSVGSTRNRSTYDHFRSEVWSKGSGSRSDMLNAYYNWKSSNVSYASSSSSYGGSNSGGSSSGGGGFSFSLSNVVVI